MTLLLTVFAAVIATVKWYSRRNDALHLEALCFMYWGASLMWLGDALFEYAELGADCFAPALEKVVNDTFLGLSVIALGLVVWLGIVLVKDPNGFVRAALQKKNQ